MKKMRRIFPVILMAVLAHAGAQSTGLNLPATDALGRALPTYEEAGELRTNKTVAMFYWTWHVGHSPTSKAYDLSRILAEHPEMANDYDNPNWDPYRDSTYFFWTEPLFGFSDGRDKWVIRKQLEMLAAAGVDVLFFDATNGSWVWTEGYEAVGEVMAEMRADGVKNVPQFAFLLNFGPLRSTVDELVQLYDELYSMGKYRESWFMWQGKPVIMGYPDALDLPELSSEEKAKRSAIKNFFTFRPGYGGYIGGPDQDNQWGWLELYPQNKYGERADGSCEFMAAGVAQNWSEETHALSAMNGPKIRGRSFTVADGFSKLTDDSYLYGYNFQEQWNRVLEVSPDIVFVTGWNEWVMGRHKSWQGVENAFPDAFDAEHSRDIEPMKGGYGDNYYYQLVSNVRKFKGLQKPEAASPEKTLSVDGTFEDWNRVAPTFIDSKGDAGHRDGYGYLDPNSPTNRPLHYVNKTGRNDIVASKVARDEKKIYFYVETAEPMTSPSDHLWMRLLIDTDRSKATGWEGYDFIVGLYATNGTAELGKSSGDWKWVEAGRVDYRVDGSKMEIAIPRELLGVSDGAPLDIEFKWIDNVDPTADIMQFYLDGDVAPLGRFNYRYFEEMAGEKQ